MATKTPSTFPLQQTFFGLSSEYLESVYEEIFILKYHGNWSFTEAYNLPIKLREWFTGRLLKQKQSEYDEGVSATEDLSTRHTLGDGPPPPAPIKINK